MSVKLHEGKRYVCRNGAVVGPLEKREGCHPYDFICHFGKPNPQLCGLSSISWDENGVWHREEPDNESDIVAEYHEYVWKWMVPDKPGVWMRAGANRDSVGTPEVIMIEDVRSGYVPGWFCFLMANPLILIPPKQRVTKRLWLRKTNMHFATVYGTVDAPPIGEVNGYEERWEPNGITPEDGRWISTNTTKEVEQ